MIDGKAYYEAVKEIVGKMIEKSPNIDIRSQDDRNAVCNSIKEFSEALINAEGYKPGR